MNLVLFFLWHLWVCLSIANSEAPFDPSNPPPPPVDVLVDNGTYGYYPTDSYVTEEALNGPKVNFIQWHERCDDGSFYFITPRGWGIGNPGPMILDPRGKLIWAKHFEQQFGGQAYDFQVQEYRGEKYLTFWLGDDRIRGHGAGYYYMLNSSYDVVRRVGAANGLSADLHEFLITSEGTALMTVYEIIEYDLSGFPDFHPSEDEQDKSYVWDSIFQEVDIESGELIFQWRASEHFIVNDTYQGIGPGGTKDDPFDWFHVNSIEKDELGNYLISARYTHSISYIDGRTGEIMWTLGGKTNAFLDLSGGDSLNFAWQHDARFLPRNTFSSIYKPPRQREGYTTRLLTMFDNAAEDQHYEYGLPQSRGLLLEVTYPDNETISRSSAGNHELHVKREFERDEEPDLNSLKIQDTNGTNPDYTVRVIKSFENPQGVRSSSQGSMQILPQASGEDPKVFVGYGLNAVWTEFDADGRVLCDVHYGATTSWERGDIQSYRSYKFPWIGRPRYPPVVEITDDDAEVYVSWNGATEISEWVLQCSDGSVEDDEDWESLMFVRKEDFETIILVPNEIGTSRFLRVIALDNKGQRLEHGASRVIDRGVISSYFPNMAATMPHEVARATPLKIFLVFSFAACTIFVLSAAYRRLLSWWSGKHHAGPLRWRTGVGYRYRLLGHS